jgi:hypothetical protein
MNNKVGKDMTGHGSGLIFSTIPALSGGTEKTHEKKHDRIASLSCYS